MQFKNKGRDFSTKKSNTKKSFVQTLTSNIFLFLIVAFAVLAIVLTLFIKNIASDLPTSQEILAHEPNLATVLYDRNGQIITHLFQENRRWVKLDDVSIWMVKAILAAEDDKFYEHSGIRPTAIFRAALVDFFFRGALQGGSTITQQLTRNLFLSKEKTIVRKAKEAVLAIRLEKIYSKDQILEMYLNTIYMGHGAYGIDAAAQIYFQKKPKDLDLTESAILAGLVAAPEKYSPFKSASNSLVRRKYVLKRMLDLDWASKADYDKSIKETPSFLKRDRLKQSLTLKDAPHFVSHILFKQLLPNYGTDMVYRGGMQIHTTIDYNLQKKAEELISAMPHEGALVALDPNTGEILALVGGRNFDESKFNRATQAYRQPGSAFKPIIYATALENGYRAIEHLLDAPLVFPNGWEPGNYSLKYSGEVTIMDAVARSLNTAAVRIAQINGISKIINFSRRIGITTPYLPEDLSISLGSASVTPLEMAVAYSTFANNGSRVEPYGIKEIKSNKGESVEQNGPKLTNAISVTTAVTTRSLLEQVTTWGTGANANIPGYETFGKTGTTNDWTDAWFIGGVPGLVVVVYVGNDNHKPLGGKKTGSIAALPVWKSFVSYAVKELKLPTTFTLPPDAGVESVRVCKKTG
ncbi:MAG: PBP1A family penicillin-binding protein, partial [Synergistaceae bacterium]|nr:PBP1A family penicillin-binding protein [Synergistaceae bacterium]